MKTQKSFSSPSPVVSVLGAGRVTRGRALMASAKACRNHRKLCRHTTIIAGPDKKIRASVSRHTPNHGPDWRVKWTRSPITGKPSIRLGGCRVKRAGKRLSSPHRPIQPANEFRIGACCQQAYGPLKGQMLTINYYPTERARSKEVIGIDNS